MPPAKPHGSFVDDLTIPDDTPMTYGQAFSKTWLLRNSGKTAWKQGYSVVFVGGTLMTAQRKYPLPQAEPGQHVELTLQMSAPNKAGKHYCDWQFADERGNRFGQVFHARVLCFPPAPTVNVPADASYFVADITIADDSPVQPGATFTKTWRVKNAGSQAWGAGYTLNFFEGTAMTSHLSQPVPPTPPGGEVNLSVELTAPKTPGSYWGDWKLKNASGQPFGAKFWVRITVPGVQPQPAPAAPTAFTPVGQPAGTTPAPAAAPTPPPLAPHLSQRDPRWSHIPLANMGGAPSIGRWGCLLTCLTMLANNLGYNTLPDQFNRDMVTRGGFINGYFTRWEALRVVYPDVSFDGKQDGPSADILRRIDASLQTGRPVPVLVDLTPTTAYSDIDQHWVLVVARSGEDYLINDPSNLMTGPTSLMGRYGKAGGKLVDAVRSALFYRK